MPNNPLTEQELYDYGVLRTLTPPAEVVGLRAASYFPAGYFMSTPYDVNGPAAWRKFHAGFISEGVIDPDRLGTGATGAGNLYLADDGVWKLVISGASELNDLDDVTINAVSNDQLLKYNSTTNQWENWTPDYIDSTTVRTIDHYNATEGQTNFIISAASYDFVDVYLNGARLILTEYTIAGNTISLVSPAELNDEIVLISYFSASIATLPTAYILRHDFVEPYSYCGRAILGNSESSSTWNIIRIEVLNDGSVITTEANNVTWTGRLTHSYS